MLNRTDRRQGLTLLELVVVLVILVALAGILVPLLPSMVSRAHTATHATNIVEIDKAVEAFNMLNHGYSDNLDSLLTGANVYANLPSNGSGTCGGELTAGTITADDLAALNSSGLTTIWTLDPTSDGTQDLLNAPYGTSTSGTALAAGNGAVLNQTAAQRLYNEPATGSSAKYVVFGFGSKASIVGHGIPESPVHFADDPGTAGNPTLTYARFGLVFRVENTAGKTLETAQFVGAVAFHPDHVSGGDAGIAEYNALNH